jgi:ATP phosphoribosyltransferase
MAPLEHIADISTRLVVNKAAMRTRHGVIQEVIEALSRAVEQAADKESTL